MSSINATTAYPLCPYCDVELENIETNWHDFVDEIVYFQRSGRCPVCQRDFKWVEDYKWDAKFHNLEEISDPNRGAGPPIRDI